MRKIGLSVFALLIAFLSGCGGGSEETPATSVPTRMISASVSPTLDTSVHRFANPITGGHFFTSNEAEKDYVLANLPAFKYEGVGYKVSSTQISGTSPVLRYSNRTSGFHFFSIDPNQQATLNADPLYKLDGTVFYAYRSQVSGSSPVYGFRNTVSGAYFWTNNDEERNYVLNNLKAYVYEGISFYAMSTSGVAKSDPQGYWTGVSSAGYTVNAAVLDNGEVWGVYSAGSTIYGALYGTSLVSGSSFSVTGTDFNFASNTSDPGTLSGPFIPKSSLTLSNTSGSIPLNYQAAYDTPATAAAIAGTWSFTGRSGSYTLIPGTITISNAGVFTLSQPGCTSSGSVVPRPGGKNIYNITLTTTGTACAVGQSSLSGVLNVDTTVTPNRFLSLALTPSKSDGIVVIGTKQNTVPVQQLTCNRAVGNGFNGISLYTPDNLFTYSLSTSSANALNLTTVGWGAANSGSNYAYSGSLAATLWAVSSPYSGGSIYGTVLGTFVPTFTGVGAYSSTQIKANNYSTNTITSSATNYNPSPGNYCLVLTLQMYMPGQCTPNPNGYCIVDWLQFNNPVTFR